MLIFVFVRCNFRFYFCIFIKYSFRCLGSKEILHRVNGKFPAGQLTAIMGPSGAGKSTLLDVLSGFRITGVNGAVYTNGRIRNLDTFRRVSCYITQDDRIQTLLTVLENMQIAADFKLGGTFKEHEKASRVSIFIFFNGCVRIRMPENFSIYMDKMIVTLQKTV